MTLKHIQRSLLVTILLVSLLATSLGQSTAQGKKQSTVQTPKQPVKYKVTFIELGSVRCIPCQQMQPIMKSIKEKYPKDVSVIFYDVWTPEGTPFADKYAIQVIPTQVFIDENGKEFFRHEGYFSEKELVKVLEKKGVKN